MEDLKTMKSDGHKQLESWKERQNTYVQNNDIEQLNQLLFDVLKSHQALASRQYEVLGLLHRVDAVLNSF